MSLLVLTGVTGQNPQYPLDHLADLIRKNQPDCCLSEHKIKHHLVTILEKGSGFERFILLSLNEERQQVGVLAMNRPDGLQQSSIEYFATTDQATDETRENLLSNALKITRGNVQVAVPLFGIDHHLLKKRGYHYQDQQKLIVRTGG